MELIEERPAKQEISGVKDTNNSNTFANSIIAEIKRNSVLDNTTDTVETPMGTRNDTATPENAASNKRKAAGAQMTC